jgi:hypothetical protein
VIAIVTELRMNFPPRPFRRPLVGVADALLGDAKPATNALLRGDGASFLSTTSGIAAVSEASAGHAPALGWAGSVQKPQAASAATTEIEREDNGHAEEGASAASRIGPVEPPVPAGDGTAAPGEAEDVQEPRDTSTKAHEEGVSSAEVLRDAMIAQGPRPGSSEPPAPADEQRAAPREAEPEQETRPSLVPANPKADSDVTGPASGHGCWEAPDLGIFQSGEAAQPVWNEFFGGALDEELHSLAEHFGAPGAVPVASFLAIAGGLLGHRLVIDVGPTWRESPMLWTMLIAPSGSKKSSTARVFVPGLRSLEAEEAQGWAERLKEVEEHNLVAGIRKREYLRQLEAAVLAGAELPPAPASELIELPSRKAPQIIIDDVTLPALTTAHAHPWNLSGLIALPDEVGPLFDRLACRSDERTAFLRSHDGGHYRSDRVTRAQIDIESFAVSIVGGAVPGRIALGDVADGFSARALWIAYELEETLPLEDTHFAASVTIEVLRSLRQLARGAKAEPLRLPLSKDARARLALVARGWRARAHGAQGHLASWFARAPSHVVRLAALRETCLASHLDAAPAEIGLASIEVAATAVENFFAPMAQRVLGAPASVEQGRIDRLSQIIAMHAEATADGRLVVNRRQVRRRAGTELADGPVFQRVWETLERAGLLRELPRAEGARGRRPGEYEVNPVLAAR